MDNVLEILRERGFIQDVSDEPQLADIVAQQPITLYWGYDATADSLHAGSVMNLMMLAWFQRCGHRPIALAGGGTTLIGDPSGRISSRPMLSEAEIEANLRGIRPQLERFLDFSDGRALALNNLEWLKPLHFIDFMRDIGSRFSLNRVLDLEAYRTRLEAGGMTFLELSYVLIQSYDFLHLNEAYDAILQVGGSDQWGNSIMGADLIRRVTGGDAFVLVTPLIETSTGAKMGKSAAGTIWLNAEKTPPFEYYQWFRNIADADVARFLALFTFLPMDEVRQLGSLPGAEINRAKEILAFEAARIMHGEAAARQAQEAAHALFAGAGSAETVPTAEIDRERLEAGMSVTDLFKQAGLVSSGNEARALINQGGLSVNGRPVSDIHCRVSLSDLDNGAIMLSRGRKQHIRAVPQG
ncbi:MAG TPA: tyrosine--tRNA ligase [Chloroflexota bacterium]|nr:tyrosine--tRNA ligase [Chloroflexota bacterium]